MCGCLPSRTISCWNTCPHRAPDGYSTFRATGGAINASTRSLPKRGFRKRSRSMRPGTRLPRQLPFRRVSPSKQSVNYWDIKTYAQRRSMRISPIRISAERWNACQNVSTRCAPTGRRRACRTSRKGSTKSLFSPLASPSGWGKSRNQQKTLRNGDCKL